MGEIRMSYEDEWMQEVQSLYPGKPPRPGSIIQEALGLYKWALEQRSSGRYIVSMDADMSDPARLLMPSIEKVAPPSQKRVDAPEHPTVTRLVAAP